MVTGSWLVISAFKLGRSAISPVERARIICRWCSTLRKVRTEFSKSWKISLRT